MKPFSNTYKTIMILLAIIIAGSCSREIDFKGSITEPKLVVNGICSLDSVVGLELSISKNRYGNLQEFTLLSDARVFLYIDGQKSEELAEEKERPGFYRGHTIVEKNRKYAVEIEHAEYGRIQSGESWIGSKVEIMGEKLQVDSTSVINPERLSDIKCMVKFNEPAAEKNYYRLIVSYSIGLTKVKPDDEGNEKTMVTMFDYYGLDESIESTDPVLLQNKTNDNMVFDESNPKYTLFTDELINGKDYELSFFLNRSMLYKIAKVDPSKGDFYSIQIELQSLSKEVYSYIKTMDGANNVTQGLFSEPFQVYSNIVDGIGIWGLYTSTVDTIRVGSFPVNGILESHFSVNY